MGIVVVGEPFYKQVKGRNRLKLIVKCDCGKQWEVEKHHLKVIRSCGCQRAKHGHSCKNGETKATRTYSSWENMNARCFNKASSRYSRYGGRGITVCERWRDFRLFLQDMGECPEGMTIERINNDGNYEPENCKWASAYEQDRNKSSNVNLTLHGVTKCATDWARELGIKPDTILTRVRRGWPEEQCILGRRNANGIGNMRTEPSVP